MLENLNDYLQFLMLFIVFAAIIFYTVYLYNLKVISTRVRKEKDYYARISRKERVRK
ncbi:MAG: hypothetical protein II712_01740 [Erysipelotrichaceae bacterium]|nr:hypothetical protein [Erysipelotrichaceae bacterium]MBQ4253528.1 hypothetical protein [Erysipelotrichaceae bacterium]